MIVEKRRGIWEKRVELFEAEMFERVRIEGMKQ